MRSLPTVISVLVLLAIAAPAGAQQPAPGAAQPAPALSPEMFKLPPSAYDAGKFEPTPAQTNSGGFNPGRIDLGSSVLELDTKRKEPDTRVGIEAVDPKRLGGISKDNSSPLPSYFGLTLTKPLN